MYNTKADDIFYSNLKNVMENGVMSGQARPKYKDGTTAHSKYLTGVFAQYDIDKGEFPITTLRPIAIKSAIKEILWIYQDQTNSLEVLEDKYNVHYWSDWEVENEPANNGDKRSIGKRYGAIVKEHQIIDKILKQLEENPYNRRNVISLWDYEAFEETDGLYPCAYNIMFDVRNVNGQMYLDCTLTQRSNDVITAHHINAIQYVALQMMIAKHFSWKPGKFFYFVNNYHVYDNQFDNVEELMKRYETREEDETNTVRNMIAKFVHEGLTEDKAYEHVHQRLSQIKDYEKPVLICHAPDGTNFYDIKPEDFELINYKPMKPQLKIDLAI